MAAGGEESDGVGEAGCGRQEGSEVMPSHLRRRPRVLLGLTGSVASIKAAPLVAALALIADVKVVATAAATHFFDAADLPLVDPGANVFADEDEWHTWRVVGDPVVHIELRRWADILLVAPLSANTLAKLANGMCDNLLTCVVRAWDFGDEEKRVLLAPAMNTCMWESPFTRRHLDAMLHLGGSGGSGGEKRGTGGDGGGDSARISGGTVGVIDPVEKVLACGDVGNGAMASVDTIVATVALHAGNLALAAD
jgi:phosphopantothenoylcysteine synthetase/decarboxylase